MAHAVAHAYEAAETHSPPHLPAAVTAITRTLCVPRSMPIETGSISHAALREQRTDVQLFQIAVASPRASAGTRGMPRRQTTPTIAASGANVSKRRRHLSHGGVAGCWNRTQNDAAKQVCAARTDLAFGGAQHPHARYVRDHLAPEIAARSTAAHAQILACCRPAAASRHSRTTKERPSYTARAISSRDHASASRCASFHWPADPETASAPRPPTGTAGTDQPARTGRCSLGQLTPERSGRPTCRMRAVHSKRLASRKRRHRAQIQAVVQSDRGRIALRSRRDRDWP